MSTGYRFSDQADVLRMEGCPRGGKGKQAFLVGDLDEGETSSRPGGSCPFGDNAPALHALGLRVFPCGGDDGKQPRFQGWPERKLSAGSVAALARSAKYAAANVGIACGLSGYVIVDVDDPDQGDAMLARFGDTPLITRTPRGGVHLWYRKKGAVRSRNLRPGLEVDIKADGGFVVVPPSVNPRSGIAYVFERGSWDDLARLPLFRLESLAAAPSNDNTKAAGPITVGERNPALHRYLLRAAPYVASLDALLAQARRFNEQNLSPPLPDAEVVKTAAGVWKCQIEGRNWVASRGHVSWPIELVQMCAPHKHGGDAIILMTVLRAKHANREEPFAVAARAMAAHQVIAGWGEHRTKTALHAAVSLGLIERVHHGGRGPGDPSRYRLAC